MASNSPAKVMDNLPDSTIGLPNIREELITTAVKFLSNPKVQTTTIEQREAFLRGKGLSEKEIKLSFERSASLQHHQGQLPNTVVPLGLPYPHGYLLPEQTGWSRFREFLNNVAIIGGVVYGLYILYKRYIAPYLFGPSKKRSPIEESIASLDKTVKSSLKDIRTDLLRVQTDLEKLNEQQNSSQTSAVTKQICDVKSEISSLKGILLNRQQFPAIEELAPTTPWIPSWQKDLEELEQTEEERDVINENEAPVSSNDDVPITNGDGAHIANGSDTSLEILDD